MNDIENNNREDLATALQDRYLVYALSTIMDRALPDARDGLKPVHRRILYAMNNLKLNPQSAFRKCSKIVGEVMGNFHPHGDKAIYDALARLAQEFSVRYPLIEGQGNFGNIDGDNPAAQRYTEARLSNYSLQMLVGLEEDSVDYKDTYDNSDREPIVLPASFPQLLANGSSGIAVGMATSVPPHNLKELLDAAKFVIDNPNCLIEDLTQIILGPDFPTGGLILDNQDKINEIYQSGKGSLRLRCRSEIENLSHGNWQLIIYEIPYQVQKGKLIEKIADLISSKKLADVQNVRDESSDRIRIVIEPRTRNVDKNKMMRSLYKFTDLETKIPINLNVLVDGISPKTCDLKELLEIFLEHQRQVLTRRSNFRLENIDRRLFIIEGLIQAYINLDRVIKIIREEDNPKAILIQEFELSDLQAESILNLRLRALRKLDEERLIKEQQDLMKEREELEDLLESKKLQWKHVKSQLKNTEASLSASARNWERLTDFHYESEDELDLINQENNDYSPVTVVLSESGWIRGYKGHNISTHSFRIRDGDKIKYCLEVTNNQKLVLITSEGRSYNLFVDQISKEKGYGEPLNILIGINGSFNVVSVFEFQSDKKGLIFSKKGLGFIVDFSSLISMTKSGRQVFEVAIDDEVVGLYELLGEKIIILSTEYKLLIFPLSNIPTLKKGKGVRLQKYKEENILDITFLAKDEKKPAIIRQLGLKDLDEIQKWYGKRGQVGKLAPKKFIRKKINRF
tara:strand:+ start:192 stop:2414 length:2223 start_codon:yes stop_codon:yes gene_type:complete